MTTERKIKKNIYTVFSHVSGVDVTKKCCVIHRSDKTIAAILFRLQWRSQVGCHVPVPASADWQCIVLRGRRLRSRTLGASGYNHNVVIGRVLCNVTNTVVASGGAYRAGFFFFLIRSVGPRSTRLVIGRKLSRQTVKRTDVFSSNSDDVARRPSSSPRRTQWGQS